jgi:hypothetical protein
MAHDPWNHAPDPGGPVRRPTEVTYEAVEKKPLSKRIPWFWLFVLASWAWTEYTEEREAARCYAHEGIYVKHGCTPNSCEPRK